MQTPLASLFRDRSAKAAGTKPICFFLGAGVDVEAGGLTFRQLKHDFIAEYRSRPHLEALSAEAIDDEFNEILEQDVLEGDRGAVLDRLFNRFDILKPTEGHILLALLAKHGAIDAVITTNFDNLLEKAEALVEGRIFQIYSPGIAQPDVQIAGPVFPPRPIYLKLHGDLEARAITHITRKELEARAYEKSFVELFRAIVRTHRLFFVGYGGWDVVVAGLIEEVDAIVEPAFWISASPPNAEAPVVRALGASRLSYLKGTFGDFMRAVAQDALASLDIANDPPLFLHSLISDRIRKANARFLANQHGGELEIRDRLLTPRQDAENKVDGFLANNEKTLAILTGPSGAGKSSLVARLCDRLGRDSFPRVLVIRAQSMTDADVGRRIISELERGVGTSMPRLFEFAAWLQANNLELVIVIDGINEFSSRTNEIAPMFRGIIDVLQRLRPYPHLKILITVRQETWNEVFPLLAAEDLRRVLWAQDGTDDRLNVITLGTFKEDEAETTFGAYARLYRPDAAWRSVPPAMRQLLADPYMMRLVMTSSAPLTGGQVNRPLMQRALRDKLETRLSPARTDSLLFRLGNCAAETLKTHNRFLSSRQLLTNGIGEDELAFLIDLGVLSRRSDGYYQFDHDRSLDYFLSTAIDQGTSICLDEVEDLLEAMRTTERLTWIRSALLSCFVAPDPACAGRRQAIISQAVNFLGDSQERLTEDSKRLHLFVADVISEVARHNSQLFADVYGPAVRNSKTPEFFRRLIVRSASLTSLETAFEIWIDTLNSDDATLAAEAEILLYDRVARAFLESWGSSLSPIDRDPLRKFFADDGVPTLTRAVRLVGLATRLGEDNLSAREWRMLRRELSDRLMRLLEGMMVPTDGLERKRWIEPLSVLSPTNANRFLFNARTDWLEQYYMDDQRRLSLTPLVDRMQSGFALSADDFWSCADSSAVVGRPIDFMITNLLWALSYRNSTTDTEKTFHLLADSFGPQTPVEVIDLFLSCAYVSMSLNERPAFDQLSALTKQLVDSCPQTYLVNPGQFRSQMHGIFLDDFDQQFEDGFNPLSFYFYNAPSQARRMMSFARTQQQDRANTVSTPLYVELLGRFERDRQPKGVIRIVHALGQMISIWPAEGLSVLSSLISRQETTVRRSVLRVLAEAYARYPIETEILMNQSGAGFGLADLYSVRCAGESRLTQRTFEQLQWCRVIQAMEATCGPDLLMKTCNALARSATWWEAVALICEAVCVGCQKNAKPH